MLCGNLRELKIPDSRRTVSGPLLAPWPAFAVSRHRLIRRWFLKLLTATGGLDIDVKYGVTIQTHCVDE